MWTMYNPFFSSLLIDTGRKSSFFSENTTTFTQSATNPASNEVTPQNEREISFQIGPFQFQRASLAVGEGLCESLKRILTFAKSMCFVFVYINMKLAKFNI